MGNVVDPLGGSYYVEALTNELAEKAWALIEEVESRGGMTKAVAEGLPKRLIAEAAAARQARAAKAEAALVGGNQCRLKAEDEMEMLDADQAKGGAGQTVRIER